MKKKDKGREKGKDKGKEKTNVMRVLDAGGIEYRSHTYDPDPTKTGVEIAGILGENPEKVFKTLVTRGASRKIYVFVIPVTAELIRLTNGRCADIITEE